MGNANRKFDASSYIEKFEANKIDLTADCEICERDLADFSRRAWAIVDPAVYLHNWHIDAVCDHLMAVSDGEIRSLLINLPPRCMKSKIVSEFWPAWTWANQAKAGYPLIGPQTKFLCLSYGLDLALDAARNHYKIVTSPWYRERWGERVRIDPKKDRVDEFATTAMGVRYSVGFGGAVLGRGGDIRIIDDPHKPDEVESELVRGAAIRQYDEEIAIRITDPKTSAEVLIMQRLTEDDLSGHVLAAERPDLVHLMLPMRYDPKRHCVTVLGWQDPRGLDEDGEKLEGIDEDGDIDPGSPMAIADGTLLWPERFSDEELLKLESRLGPFGTAGRLQQAPVPRGGGIFKAEWWRLWNDSKYPDFSTVLVSLDTASTEKEENDEAALTAWGVFAGENGKPQIMLIDAWEGFLEFAPLVEKTAKMCQMPNGNTQMKADYLLVEAKNIGHPVMTEIRRLYGTRQWQTLPFNPIGDKVTRAISIQHMFSGEHRLDLATGMRTWTGGCVWAPDTQWAQMVIDRCGSFPKGKRKGIVDTTSQAIKFLRDNAVLMTPEEYEDERTEELRYRKPLKPLYNV